MLNRPKDYLVAVFRSFGRAISGPIFAIASLVLLVMQLAITDAPTITRVLKWGAWLTLGLAVLMIFVAQYEAWKAQCEAREGIEKKLTVALADGPEVWLSFENSLSFTGFVVESRSRGKDAINVSVDPFETNRYRAESPTLPSVRYGEPPQALVTRMTDKKCNLQFVDMDLGEMLKDSSDDFRCSLQFTLRYSDSWGNRFRRRATIDIDRVRLAVNDLPPIFNHKIEPDNDAQPGPPA